jgi:uncharacterized protein (TIGR03435 family)
MTQHLARKAIGSFAAVCAFLAFSIANLPLVRAQSPESDWEKSAGGHLEFDVASLKPHKSDDTVAESDNIPLGPNDAFSPTGGLFSATNVPLIQYFIFAFKLTPYQWGIVRSQLPSWVNSRNYDVEARATGNPAKNQYRLMVQALLADRFKLSYHYETRQVPVFAMVLIKSGKLGPQIRPHIDDPPCDPKSVAIVQSGAAQPTIAGGFPLTCGGGAFLQPAAPDRIRMGGRNIPMAVIANILPPRGGVDRPVVDKTGLGGTYDFILEWTPPQVDENPDASGPTFLEAWRDQFGLKLEPATGPVQTIVIDHIEEPTPN